MMKAGVFRRTLPMIAFAAVIAAGIAAGSQALAEAPPPQGTGALAATLPVHIKPGPLGQALKAFAATAKAHLVFSESAVAGKTTPGLDGNFAGFEALTRLLAGSDLTFQQSGGDVVITPAVASADMPNGGKPSPALRRAWDKFFQTMQEARADLERTQRFKAEPWTRAKAYHVLFEAEAMAYNFVISPRLDHPRLQEATGWQVNNYTLGLNGADGKYGLLFLDGRQTYRVRVRYGDVRLILMEVYSHVMGSDDAKMMGNYDLSNFKPSADGSVDIALSATKQDGNWIKLDPSSTDNWILIRRWLLDWNKDTGSVRVEMTSAPPAGYYDDEEFSEPAITKRVERAAQLVKYCVDTFAIADFDMYKSASGGQVNRIALMPGTMVSQIGSPTSKYAFGLFSLKDDEALIIKLDPVPTDAAYWSFQLADPWSRSLDFVNRQTSLNMAQISVEPDGKAWVVISKKDPGIQNWLDTAGHADGQIAFRNYRSRTVSVPTAQKVKLSQIGNYLPKDIKRVTPAERKAAIDYRREGIIKAYGNVF